MSALAVWTVVNPFGVARDNQNQVWHAGHVMDVIEMESGDILVASINGGVWRIAANGDASPLSNDWDNEDTRSLAFGPDGPQHVFAACAGYGRNGALFVTDPSSANPLNSWSNIQIPDAVGFIYRILVLPRSRRIVIAAESGLWWSPIPPPSGYQWTQPTQGRPLNRCVGLAEGPNETIVATVYGVGLFQGTWTPNGELHMQAANVMDGLITAFDDGTVYLSPGGRNLDGGGNTVLVYNAGQQVQAMIPYQNGALTAFSGGGVYFSPDGQNLGGGPNTSQVFDGRAPGLPTILKVVAMTPYRNGIVVAFDNHSVYLSPDGQNLAGGGNTVLVYGGNQAIQAMMHYRGGVLAAFSGGSIYSSPDGQHLGGGGQTTRVYTGNPGDKVVAMIPYQNGVITAFTDHRVFYSPDGQNLGGGGRTTTVYAGTQSVRAMLPYRNGVLTAFSGGAIYFSPDGSHLGGGGATTRIYDGGGLRVVAMMPYLNSGIVPTRMLHTWVASCAGDRNIVYALANGGGPASDSIYALLSSNDGGHNWTRIYGQVINNPNATDLSAAGGGLGGYDGCLAVSPVDSAVVALGWISGPFVSQDSGNTWRQYGDSPNLAGGFDPALHADMHAVYFNPSGQRLYSGSDGGVAAADVQTGVSGPPVLNNFVSIFNKNFANLQFAGWPSKGIYGTFSVNDQLMAGGLQDNGDVYCQWRLPSGWRQAAGSDGMANMLVPGGDLFFNNNVPGDAAGGKRGQWNGNSIIDLGIVPVLRADGTFDPAGSGGRQGHDMVVEAVSVPGLGSTLAGNAQSQILAVAGVLNDVYGLFPDNNANPSWHWELLATLQLAQDDFITAVGSYAGFTILVGTQKGRIYFVAPGQAPVSVSMPTPSTGRVTQFLLMDLAPVRGYALADNGQKLLRLTYDAARQGSWVEVSLAGASPDAIFSVATDWNTAPPTLYIATDKRVFITSDEGAHWSDFSQGLPRDPHCAGLRISSNRLFLSTWGRSVWSTGLWEAITITLPPGPPSPPPGPIVITI
jgi:hypothetical protein